MRTKSEHMSCFQTLAAQWRALGLLLVLLARHVHAGKRLGRREAYAQAETLELWSRTAMCALTQQMTALSDHPPQTEDEASAHAHLTAIAVCLLGLAMLAAKMKAELKGLAAALPFDGLETFAEMLRPPMRACAPNYLDSS